MSKRYSGKQVTKALHKAGFVIVSQKGSHIKMRGIWNGKLQTVIVPNHKQIAVGTFGSILRQADMERKEIEKLIK